MLPALILVLLNRPAAAHERSTSYSAWDIHGRRAHVTVRLSRLDISRFPWAQNEGAELERGLANYVTAGLQLRADATPCTLAVPPRRLPAEASRVVVEWDLTCPAGEPLVIKSDLLFDLAPTHLHFARVARDDGRATERVLSADERLWVLDAETSASGEPSGGTSLAAYVVMGVEHIWTGYDHLAFLLGLLLIEGSLVEVAKVVTGFTVAHSVTLGVATLGYVRPAAPPIEALIGLSIAIVAAENLWLSGGMGALLPAALAGVLFCLAAAGAAGIGQVPALTLAGIALFTFCYFGLLARAARPARLRWAIAFVFGLIHGFGFASVLAEARLSPERLARALFGFNAGVEVGQLAVVLALWPVLSWIARPERVHVRRWVIEIGSAAVLALGVFWFVSRAYG